MTSLDQSAVDKVIARAQREVEDGSVAASQLAIGFDGEVVVHEAFGTADLDSRICAYSATKPFVASVVWQLLGEGAVSPETPVCEVLPEFATNGKDAVTVDHLLQHTSGFPHAPLHPKVWADPVGRRDAYSRWRLSWPVGSKFEYHAVSAHWVLADLILELTGTDHRDALRQRVLEPLGLTSFVLGPPVDAQVGIIDHEPVGEAPSPEELEAVLGVREIPSDNVAEAALIALNDPRARAAGVPGGGGITTAADVAAFYQGLLHDPAGLWDPGVLSDATSVVRNTFPEPMLGHPVNRTRGLVVAGGDGQSHLRGMGRTVSPLAFGHNGAGGQVAWADPVTGLSFSYLTNGLPRNLIQEHRRTTAVSSLAGVCAD